MQGRKTEHWFQEKALSNNVKQEKRSMCIVHRIVEKTRLSGFPVRIISFEGETPKGTTVSTRSLERLPENGMMVFTEHTSQKITSHIKLPPLMTGTRPILNPKHFERVDDNEPWSRMVPTTRRQVQRLQAKSPLDYVFGGIEPIHRPAESVKTGSHGRYEHRHIHVKHIRRTKAELKRQFAT